MICVLSRATLLFLFSRRPWKQPVRPSLRTRPCVRQAASPLSTGGIPLSAVACVPPRAQSCARLCKAVQGCVLIRNVLCLSQGELQALTCSWSGWPPSRRSEGASLVIGREAVLCEGPQAARQSRGSGEEPDGPCRAAVAGATQSWKEDASVTIAITTIAKQTIRNFNAINHYYHSPSKLSPQQHHHHRPSLPQACPPGVRPRQGHGRFKGLPTPLPWARVEEGCTCMSSTRVCDTGA